MITGCKDNKEMGENFFRLLLSFYEMYQLPDYGGTWLVAFQFFFVSLQADINLK